ncbi:2-oxoacid:acceptor oxidoreductase family protein [Desulfomicrobium sp. ZS1]|uniref:2-oxoacid:acceptor oxidoreductase family protein n=1 Tax=Desulfomicrobium sp. ZS1 TaxID=2952228 RepID=UPI0020B3F8C3|nr:2-oxoacid:acceptor oxidoreductase family protein [Desulfomicrobium sp. ZS1]UTF50387.1 2-oxoacid:acceptor oxidoreductase family protein [Desulfomicrobium sp. ZS1]
MPKQHELNRFEIRLSGTGGQGILTLGKIMGQVLAIDHGFFVTQTQSYGPEARGGASRADLVISSHRISYPKPVNLDMLVALSQEACNLYFRNLKPVGFLLVDTSLVTQTPSNIYWGLPFTSMARDKIGMPQTTNIICLGALSHFLPFMNFANVKKALASVLPAKILDVNVKALTLGHSQAKKLYPDAPEKWTFFSPTTMESEQ